MAATLSPAAKKIPLTAAGGDFAAVPFFAPLAMHGAGHRFVLLDGRRDSAAAELHALLARAAADFDQIIIAEPAKNADFALRFYNRGGSLALACGNGTRCAAAWFMQAADTQETLIATASGLIPCWRDKQKQVWTDLGAPRNTDQAIRLQQKDAAYPSLDLHMPDLPAFFAVSMGNPHAVFFLPPESAAEVEALAPLILQHKTIKKVFPSGVNISFVWSFVRREKTFLRMEVFERGAGLTQACGTAAAAAFAAARRQKMAGEEADIHIPGGRLKARQGKNGHINLTGPVHIGPVHIDLVHSGSASGS